MRVAGICCLLVSVLSFPASSQDAETTYGIEWRDLEKAIESYSLVRDKELMAIERLKKIAAILQDSAYDADVPVSVLRRLDQGLGEAWEEAHALSRQTSKLRSGLYDRMDLLAQLAREMEVQGSTSQKRSEPAGRWRFEASPMGVTGVWELELIGSQIHGQYSVANGTLMLLRGSYFGGHLKLQRLGASLEVVGMINGDLDPETGELSGTWNNRELGSGEHVQGEWRAWPIEEELPITGSRGPQD